jgi:predicted ABC-class ATPase
MNVPFTIPSNAELEKEFVSQAAKRGMVSSGRHSQAGKGRHGSGWLVATGATARQPHICGNGASEI